MPALTKHRIAIIGHRGAAGLAPENTLPSVAAALNCGVDYIEVDLRQTKDGQLIIMHDASVGRTTNGQGLVRNMDYSKLAPLNAGTALLPCKIPLLSEILESVAGRPVTLIIELKQRGMLENLQAIIGPLAYEKLLLTSFNRHVLSAAQKALPHVPRAALFFFLPHGDSVACYCPFWLTAILFPWRLRRWQKKGLKVFVWTVDHPRIMRHCIKLGVDGIITNRPDILSTLL